MLIFRIMLHELTDWVNKAIFLQETYHRTQIQFPNLIHSMEATVSVEIGELFTIYWWLSVRVRPPSYGCTREVVKNERSVAQPLPKCIHDTREARLPWTNWFVSTNWNLTGMHFIGFIASSACVREIMEHADEVSKLLGGNCVTLLKMLSTENLSKQRFRATDGHRKWTFRMPDY